MAGGGRSGSFVIDGMEALLLAVILFFRLLGAVLIIGNAAGLESSCCSSFSFGIPWTAFLVVFPLLGVLLLVADFPFAVALVGLSECCAWERAAAALGVGFLSGRRRVDTFADWNNTEPACGVGFVVSLLSMDGAASFLNETRRCFSLLVMSSSSFSSSSSSSP